MDSDDEDVMAALMDEQLAVVATTRDAIGDDEHLAILVSLLAMIARDDKPVIGGSTPAGATQDEAKAEDGRLLHALCRLLRQQSIAR
jgi:hypothetical protein